MYWRQIAPVLDDMRVLTAADGIPLALLCDALADYVAARKAIDTAEEETGTRFIAATDKGNLIQHPAVGVANKSWERVLKACREFGLTPSSRSSVRVAGAERDDDPLLDLLRRKGVTGS
jgi:P27 family predicted phage terminase small subunit